MVELPDCHHVFHHTCVNRCQKPMLTDPRQQPNTIPTHDQIFSESTPNPTSDPRHFGCLFGVQMAPRRATSKHCSRARVSAV